MDYSAIRLLFPDYKIENMQLISYREKTLGEPQFVLYDKDNNFLLYEHEYMEIAEYIREIMNIHPKIEKAKSKTARAWMIQEDKMNELNRNDSDNESILLPTISALINHPGFKYNLQELKKVNIYQFYDSVKRLQIYEQTRAMWNGRYSGFADMSKIDDKYFNFMREIS